MTAIGVPLSLPARQSVSARRALPWLVGAAAVAGTVLSAEHATVAGPQVVLVAWITLSYVFAGLIAVWRRPGTPFGRLMVLAGFGMFLSSLSVSDVSSLYTLGVAFDLLAAVLFLHVFLAFLAGLLDARLARSAVGDLFIALRSDPGPAGLRAALVRALRDPSLTLAYWLPEFQVYADGDGHPVALPVGVEARATTLVNRNGAPVAALSHDAALLEDPGLLDAVAAAAAIALENARLSIELRARLDELKGSRARIV